MSHPDDVSDRTQKFEFPHGEGWGLGHGGDDGRVDAQHDPGVFEANEHVVERFRVAGRNPRIGRHADEHHGVGLDHRSIEHPWIARPHPDDLVGVDAVAQQPDDGVGGRLAGSDDHIGAG